MDFGKSNDFFKFSAFLVFEMSEHVSLPVISEHSHCFKNILPHTKAWTDKLLASMFPGKRINECALTLRGGDWHLRTSSCLLGSPLLCGGAAWPSISSDLQCGLRKSKDELFLFFRWFPSGSPSVFFILLIFPFLKIKKSLSLGYLFLVFKGIDVVVLGSSCFTGSAFLYKPEK